VDRTALVSNNELEISTQDREELRRYLLGQMVEADLSQVEERLMSESDLYAELLIFEDELIDQYVRGQMSETDRASFESYFLQSSEHQQKLRFAQALSKYVDRAVGQPTDEFKAEAAPAPSPVADTYYAHPASPSAKTRRFWSWPFPIPALNYALAAVVVIAIVGIAWMALRSSRPAGPGKVFEATLVPGGVVREGGEIQTISLAAGTDTLRLRLILPSEQYPNYKTVLVDSNGTSAVTRDDLTPIDTFGKKSLLFDIPATTLRPDTYRLRLSARATGAYEEIASYNFRIR